MNKVQLRFEQWIMMLCCYKNDRFTYCGKEEQ